MRQLYRIVIVALSCVFCLAAFADDECPMGYGYKINQGAGGCVDLGTLNWKYNTMYRSNVFTVSIPDFKYPASNSYPEIHTKCDKFVHHYTGISQLHSGEFRAINNDLFFCMEPYTDVTSFKNAMKGVYFYYQRATDENWAPPDNNTVCNSSYGGSYELPAIEECTLCPPNTYKDVVGNTDCTQCPPDLMSPSGAKSVNECGRILHVGNYVAFMPVGKRTEHGLCTMLDGAKYCADVYEKE